MPGLRIQDQKWGSGLAKALVGWHSLGGAEEEEEEEEDHNDDDDNDTKSSCAFNRRRGNPIKSM
jgi:hypothetical protein